MKVSEILYEPLPIARIGIEKESQEVIIATDFSCFTQMIEEYISFGAIKIVIPQSSPEIKSLNQMPTILNKRIKIIDDANEIQTVNRILSAIRKEFSVKINEENNYLKFKKDTPRNIINNIQNTHKIVKKLSLGFNHGIQIDINTEVSKCTIRQLRSQIKDTNSRLILAQLEGLLSQYNEIKFQAIAPLKDKKYTEIITHFDELINDSTYLDYSNSITQLSIPDKRNKAISELKNISRIIGSKEYIHNGWNFITKIVKAWSGVPLPESKTIASIIQDKQFPLLVDMGSARNNALDMWKNSTYPNNPLKQNGESFNKHNIDWMPPLDSMKTQNNNYLSLGTAGELLTSLQNYTK